MNRLISLLRAHPSVRLAVVYGSVARGDDRPGRDLDLLVSFAHEQALTAASLAVALTEEMGRPVQMVTLVTA
jgi:predicted nucleotidyltransferase